MDIMYDVYTTIIVTSSIYKFHTNNNNNNDYLNYNDNNDNIIVFIK